MQEVELYPHQLTAVKELSNGKILCGGTGVGKGHVALRYYTENEAPKDIVVITTGKKRDKLDWEGEAILHGIGTDVSMPGRGTILVDSWNNVAKYTDRRDCFFIFDEQRVVGGGSWVKAFYKICRANRWILLSATPGDTWMDYIPVFVANGLYANRTEFIREHVVYSAFTKYPKVERFIGVNRLVKHKNNLLVDMPYERHTVRHIHHYDVDYDKEAYDKAGKTRWNPFTDAPMVDAGEYYRVVRKITNSDPSRLEACKKLLEKHPKIIIFYNFDYELEELRKLNEIPWLAVSEYNGHKHQEIPDHPFWAYLVQYRSGAEGWNCVETDTLIFYSMTYSYRDFAQVLGRIDRLNTPFVDLHYYILKSLAPIDKMIMKSHKIKANFNERKHVPEPFKTGDS